MKATLGMTWITAGFIAGSVALNIPVPVAVPVVDLIVLSVGYVTEVLILLVVEDFVLPIVEADAVSADTEFDKEVVPIPAPRT